MQRNLTPLSLKVTGVLSVLAENPALEGTSQGHIRVPILATIVAIRLVILRVLHTVRHRGSLEHNSSRTFSTHPQSKDTTIPQDQRAKERFPPWPVSRWRGDDTTALQNQKGYVTGLSGSSDKEPMAGVGCVAIRYRYTHVLLVSYGHRPI